MFERLGQVFKSVLVTFANFTKMKYSPTAWQRLSEASRFGSNEASLSAIKECESLAITLVRVAEAVSSARWQVVGPDEKPLPPEHPLIIALKKPNQTATWNDFIETAVFQLLPTGNWYVLKDPVSLAGNFMRLWNLRPDKTRPIEDPIVQIAGYEHYSKDGIRYVFPPEKIVHIKLPNPFDDYVGLGRTELIDATLNMDFATLRYNLNFFKHGASLGTILEATHDMSKETKDAIVRQFREMHSGFENAHRVAILSNGLKLSPEGSGATPKESDWATTRSKIGDTVGGLFGVPPIKRGIVENANRANSVTQQLIFNEDAVIPLLRRLELGLTQLVLTWGPYKFRFIDPVVKGDDTQAQISTMDFQMGALSPNERRIQNGLEPISKPGMDDYYLPIGMMKVGEEVNLFGAKPLPSGGDELKPPPKIDSGGGGGDLNLPPTLKGEGPFPKGSALQRRVLRFLVGGRAKTERKLFKAYSTWIKAFGDQAALRLEEQAENRSLFTKKAVDEYLDENGLLTYVEPIYTAELNTQFDALTSLFSYDGTFSRTSEAAAKIRLAEMVKGIEETTRAELETIIRDGAGQGLSPTDIANGTADGSFVGIKDSFSQYSQERAQLIARTETVRLQDQASVEAYSQMGVKNLDVIGCEDFVIMPGQIYGCNSQNVPATVAYGVEFHPNHKGAWVPRLEE